MKYTKQKTIHFTCKKAILIKILFLLLPLLDIVYHFSQRHYFKDQNQIFQQFQKKLIFFLDDFSNLIKIKSAFNCFWAIQFSTKFNFRVNYARAGLENKFNL